MASRTPATQQSLSKKSNELAAASSQVVAHRVTRMVMAGPMPSQRDRTEFTRMVNEKHEAFAESWLAMAAQSLVAQQAIATTAWRSMFYPWLGGGATPGAWPSRCNGRAWA